MRLVLGLTLAAGAIATALLWAASPELAQGWMTVAEGHLGGNVESAALAAAPLLAVLRFVVPAATLLTLLGLLRADAVALGLRRAAAELAALTRVSRQSGREAR